MYQNNMNPRSRPPRPYNNQRSDEQQNIQQNVQQNVKKDKHDIRVITFNLLSDKYVSPRYFPTIKPKHLDFNTRINRTKHLIESWMKVNFIICLQEYSKGWSDALFDFFKSKCYEVVEVHYSDGKMGIAIAFPSKHYTMIESYSDSFSRDIQHIHDTFKVMCTRLDLFPFDVKLQDTICQELEQAASAPNPFLILTLSAKYYGKDVGKNLVIATYHMPCRFTMKYYIIAHIRAMKVRAGEALKRARARYPGDSSLVVVGDFNIIPSSPEYKLLACIDYTDDELKDQKYVEVANSIELYRGLGMNITDGVKFRSTYLTLNGAEPRYTNTSIKQDSSFVECIDYILLGDSIDIRSCQVGLTVEDPIANPSPNNLCPSDHLPLSASLYI